MNPRHFLYVILFTLLTFAAVAQPQPSARVKTYGFYKGDSSYSQNLILVDTAVYMDYLDFWAPGYSPCYSDVSQNIFFYDSSEVWKGFDPSSGGFQQKIKHIQPVTGEYNVNFINNEIYQDLDTATNQWMNVSRIRHGFAGFPISNDTFFVWRNNGWLLTGSLSSNPYYGDTIKYFDTSSMTFINKTFRSLIPPAGTPDTVLFATWNNLSGAWEPDSMEINHINWHLKRKWDNISSSWKNYTKDIFSVSGSAHLQLHQVWSGGWVTQWRDSSVSQFSRFREIWDNASQQFILKTRWLDSADGTAYAEITHRLRQEYVNGNWVYGPESYFRHYNYEDYLYSRWEGIDELPSGIASIDLFPVPTNDVLNIRMEWKKPQPFDLAVTDGVGRTVLQWKEKGVTSYSKSVVTSFLPMGRYQLTIRSEGGSVSRGFVIVR